MTPIQLKTFRAQRIRAAQASHPGGIATQPSIKVVAGSSGAAPYLYVCNAMEGPIDSVTVVGPAGGSGTVIASGVAGWTPGTGGFTVIQVSRVQFASVLGANSASITVATAFGAPYTAAMDFTTLGGTDLVLYCHENAMVLTNPAGEVMQLAFS
jgi:hypothetical protein